MINYRGEKKGIPFGLCLKNLSPISCYPNVLFIHGGQQIYWKNTFVPLTCLSEFYDLDENIKSITLYISAYNLECTT